MKLRSSMALAVCFTAAFPAKADYPYVKLNYARTMGDATVTDTTDTLQAIADLDVAGGNLIGFAIGSDWALSPSKWGQFAWEGEFAYRNASVNGATISGSVGGGFIDGAELDSVKNYTLMGNIWWRPAVFGQIRPYIGGGVGGAYLPSGGLSQDSIYAIAYQFGGGVDYEFKNGIRAGVGYRHFELSANDLDDDDPLFTFETESDVSEDSLYISASVPFALITGDKDGVRRVSHAQSPEAAAEHARAKAEKIRVAAKRKEEKRLASEEKARRKAEEKAARAAEKAARKAAKGGETDEGDKSGGLFAKLNPFGGKSGKGNLAAPERLTPPAQAQKDGFSGIRVASVKTAPSVKPANASIAGRQAISPTNVSLRTTEIRGDAAPAALIYFAQLGAYSSEGFAHEMWSKKSSRQPQVLNGEPYVVEPLLRRSDDKTLYLLRVGPYDKESAKAVCALVAGDCMVVGG